MTCGFDAAGYESCGKSAGHCGCEGRLTGWQPNHDGMTNSRTFRFLSYGGYRSPLKSSFVLW